MRAFGLVVAWVVLAAAFAAQMARWLRVLQREHYEPRAMSQFLGRWSALPTASASAPPRRRARRPLTLTYVMMMAVIVALLVRSAALVVAVTALYGLLCPWGLSLRGRTGSLEWTRRLRAVATVALLIALAVVALGLLAPEPTSGLLLMVWSVPPLLDLSTRLRRPFEERQAGRFVARARARLEAVRPRVVAITGSYGKTSTKNHLVEILAGERVVASPRSFNNRAGLSRAINENLVDGTAVFIAEMGTYGEGEIRELTSWCVPEIAVVTAIGPVHLERMGSMDVIERAKHEITERATTVVVNVDDERLATWPEQLVASGKVVYRVGSRNVDAALRVVPDGERFAVLYEGAPLGSFERVPGVQATNVACALGVALALGVNSDELVVRAQRVMPVASRLNVATAPSGVIVIDDTFNANPSSAVAALDALGALKVTRRVVVTPGLIELGREQYEENFRLAQRVEAIGAELVAVARTNALALTAGYGPSARRFDHRDGAVAWVREQLGHGDAVLYLNDLPDHYP